MGIQYQSYQPQPPVAKPKQTIQQFQVAVVLPPGAKPPQGNQPPGGPSNPDFIWLQIPASYFTSQSPPLSPDQLATRPPPAGPDTFMTFRPPAAPISPDNLIIQRPPPAAAGPDTVMKPKPPPLSLFEPPRPATTGAPVEVLLRKCLAPRGQFPSDSCNKYVNCWDGVAVEQFCPESLVFNPKGYCDYAYNVDCGGKPIEAIPPPPTPIDTTTATPGQVSSQAPTTVTTAAPPTVIVTLPTIDPTLRKKCLKPRGQFRSNACNKYVNCWDDVVLEQECPEGLLFSNKGYCDFPSNVDCQNLAVPARNGITMDEECPIAFGTFRDKANCSHYFTCIGGKVVANYNCPEGFSFNDNIGVCDYADRVDCSKEPLIFSPRANFLSNVPKDFMEKIDGCKPGSVFPLNPQCTAACLCHDGGSEVVQCPLGLSYDTHSDKCLQPHLAKW
ncbi:hypothetical protein Zmor_000208 [Zophobas morio]|uniref:Chitin-binding type-2 domain-containing protein n=1 Tax=Zophobas morio TaxID=2755281 RepID=A0AA38MR32_9CUCU|nr:hypothetical protein Zmor_000208 [Zophobas morio]